MADGGCILKQITSKAATLLGHVSACDMNAVDNSTVEPASPVVAPAKSCAVGLAASQNCLAVVPACAPAVGFAESRNCVIVVPACASAAGSAASENCVTVGSADAFGSVVVEPTEVPPFVVLVVPPTSEVAAYGSPFQTKTASVSLMELTARGETSARQPFCGLELRLRPLLVVLGRRGKGRKSCRVGSRRNPHVSCTCPCTHSH